MNASSCCVPGAASTVCVRLCRPPKVAGKVIASTCRQAGRRAGGRQGRESTRRGRNSHQMNAVCGLKSLLPTPLSTSSYQAITHLQVPLLLPPLNDAVTGPAVWHY
jgi:hypothetical protein